MQLQTVSERGRDTLRFGLVSAGAELSFWLFHHFADQLFDSDVVYRGFFSFFLKR